VHRWSDGRPSTLYHATNTASALPPQPVAPSMRASLLGFLHPGEMRQPRFDSIARIRFKFALEHADDREVRTNGRYKRSHQDVIGPPHRTHPDPPLVLVAGCALRSTSPHRRCWHFANNIGAWLPLHALDEAIACDARDIQAVHDAVSASRSWDDPSLLEFLLGGLNTRNGHCRARHGIVLPEPFSHRLPL
jgi:hypothetical protein